MSEKICQSCGMPMQSVEMFGTNQGGSKNDDYCVYCFSEGNFTDNMTSMEEMINECVPHMVKEGMSEVDAKNILLNTLPNLKRWQQV